MISAQEVNELRSKTGAGMMDCKKALTECNGNMEEAMEWLRKKGISKAEKKSSRIAAEGLANIYTKDNKAVILEVNCETDFVTKNTEFAEMINDIGNAILESDVKTIEEANDLTVKGEKISDYIVSKTAKIGEKLSFRRMEVITKANNENFGTYLHMGGKIAVLVVVENASESVAKDVAMQAAAMRPEYLCKEDVPESILNKEKEILKEQAINEGKPADIAEKMVNGRISKYYKEHCLIHQEFVKDNSMDIETYVKKNGGSVKAMYRYEVGEGMEKRCENFAEEVQKQING